MPHTNQLIEDKTMEIINAFPVTKNGYLLHQKLGFTKVTIKDILTNLLSQTEQETAKAFGGCKSCYGKGYSTNIDFASGRGVHFQTDYYLPCKECDRGKQVAEMIEKTEQECDKRWRTLIENKKIKMYDNWATTHDRSSDRFTKLTKEEKTINSTLDDLLSNK